MILLLIIVIFFIFIVFWLCYNAPPLSIAVTHTNREFVALVALSPYINI